MIKGAQKIWLLYQKAALEEGQKRGIQPTRFPGQPPGEQGKRFSRLLDPIASLRRLKTCEKKGRKVDDFSEDKNPFRFFHLKNIDFATFFFRTFSASSVRRLGLKTSLLAISQRRFLIKQPNLLCPTHPSSWLMPGVHLVLPSPVTEVVAPQVFPSFCMRRCVVVHASIFERRGFSPTRVAKSSFQKLPTAHPGAGQE